MTTISAIMDSSFESEVANATVPVVVDFWAQWCGPCKAIAPILEELAKHYANRVKFVKMDVDQNPATPAKFGVRGIPTLILFKNGEVQATQVGMVGKAELINFIDGHL